MPYALRRASALLFSRIKDGAMYEVTIRKMYRHADGSTVLYASKPTPVLPAMGLFRVVQKSDGKPEMYHGKQMPRGSER